MTRVATALLVLVVAGTACRGVAAFSMGRLFPASRRGVRGTLLSSLASSKVSANTMKGAMKQAIIKSQKQEATKPSINIKQEATKPSYIKPEKVKPSIYVNQEAIKPSINTQQEAVKQQVTKEAAKIKDTKTKVKPRHPIPVTDSPIYYIRLPPRPYVYMPGLGYVSPNRNHFTFKRPDVDFLNNGKPVNLFHFKAPSTPAHFFPTTTTATTTTTSTTTTTPPPPTTSKPQKPATTRKPSLITWLTGPWFFNGRPSDLFIYRSPYVPSHMNTHHQTYSRPGIYSK